MSQTLRMLWATWHLVRHRYYMVALNHIGHLHRDAPEVTRRALVSQLVVNEFVRGER